MANVPQKSLKYPGLSDTYTFIQESDVLASIASRIDSTLATSGRAADAKATGDALNLKVNISDIDNTLSTTGKPADAKAVGDKIAAVNAQVISPESFGAVGDGTTNDTSAFTLLLSSNNHNIVCAPGATYYIASAISCSNKHINLNGAKLKLAATFTLTDGNTIENGEIYQTGVTSFSVPAISVTGKNNAIRQISFTGYGSGVHYIFTRKDSYETIIEQCEFDGKCAIGIHVGGEKCTIRQCVFANTESNSLYSNCIKLSADDSTDTTTPCARNTIIEQCKFGKVNDNCVDCFSGARGLIIRQCEFNNGTSSAIEIKNIAMNPELDSVSSGYSIEGIRECVNIDIDGCTFLGTGYIATVTSTKSANTDDYIPPKNITFRNCIAPNVDGSAIALGEQINGVIIDNLMLPGLTANRMLNLYGKNVNLRNCNLPRSTVIIYGEALIENSTIYKITTAGVSTVATIRNIKSVTSSEPLVAVPYGAYVRVENCDARNSNWLIGLNGAPTVLLALNNFTKNGINNGYAGSGGKVYLIGNLYTGSLSAAATAIVESVNNYKVT